MKSRNIILLAVILNLVAVSVLAYTTPAPDSMGFAMYDILVNKILCGPIGFVGGVCCVAMGGRQLIHYNYADAGPPFFGLSAGVPLGCFVWWFAAAGILNADQMLLSVGAMI